MLNPSIMVRKPYSSYWTANITLVIQFIGDQLSKRRSNEEVPRTLRKTIFGFTLLILAVSALGLFSVNALRTEKEVKVAPKETLAPVTIFDGTVSTKAEVQIQFAVNSSGALILLLYNEKPAGYPDWSQVANNPFYAGMPYGTTMGNARVTIFGDYVKVVNVGTLWVAVGDAVSNGNPKLVSIPTGTFTALIGIEFAWGELYQSKNAFGGVCQATYCNEGYRTHFVDGTAQLRILFVPLNTLTKITKTYHNYSPWDWRLPQIPNHVLVESITGFNNSCGNGCYSSEWNLPPLQTGIVSYYLAPDTLSQ
jgi:hypothetical protein